MHNSVGNKQANESTGVKEERRAGKELREYQGDYRRIQETNSAKTDEIIKKYIMEVSLEVLYLSKLNLIYFEARKSLFSHYVNNVFFVTLFFLWSPVTK